MVNAIKSEITLRKNYLKGTSVETIYFGGGTPSLLSGQQLNSILDEIANNFEITSDSEITLEANPDDLSKKKLFELSSVGINRLSIGIQSFHDQVLTYLNRAHNSQEASECLEHARNAGFDNISIDLIYGIPDRSDSLWIKDLDLATTYRPEHISAYSLTIEPETTFGRWQSKGDFPALDEDHAAHQFEILLSHLTNAGYEQYEISNFCSLGMYSKHNSNYWKQKKYLGIGPSAHSYDQKSRQFNINKNGLYIKEINEGRIPATIEKLSINDMVNEYLLTTLRTKWGSDLQYLESMFSYELNPADNQYLANVIENGYANIKSNRLTLTDAGKLFADKIASDLFIH